MTKKPLHVYQFKISLLEIKPLIWRRIQVLETYTFWNLHVAIQDAMVGRILIYMNLISSTQQPIPTP